MYNYKKLMSYNLKEVEGGGFLICTDDVTTW